MTFFDEFATYVQI